MSLKTVYSAEVIVNKWARHYNLLIERAQARASSKKEANKILGYSEAHHIVPKCMGGTDEKSNIAHLSAKEHFVAHQLLVKIYPNILGLVFACYKMSIDNGNNERINIRKYEWLRKKQAKINSELKRGKNKNNDAGMKRLSLWRSTQNKFNNEGIAKSCISKQGRTKENHTGIASMSAKKTGRTKETCPGLESSSKKQKGRSKETHQYLKIKSQQTRFLDDYQLETLMYLKSLQIKHRNIVYYFKIQNIDLAISTISTVFTRNKHQFANYTGENIKCL